MNDLYEVSSCDLLKFTISYKTPIFIGQNKRQIFFIIQRGIAPIGKFSIFKEWGKIFIGQREVERFIIGQRERLIYDFFLIQDNSHCPREEERVIIGQRVREISDLLIQETLIVKERKR